MLIKHVRIPLHHLWHRRNEVRCECRQQRGIQHGRGGRDRCGGREGGDGGIGATSTGATEIRVRLAAHRGEKEEQRRGDCSRRDPRQSSAAREKARAQHKGGTQERRSTASAHEEASTTTHTHTPLFLSQQMTRESLTRTKHEAAQAAVNGMYNKTHTIGIFPDRLAPLPDQGACMTGRTRKRRRLSLFALVSGARVRCWSRRSFPVCAHTRRLG